MRSRVLHPSGYRRMRWKNGGGWTTELAVFPESGVNAGSTFDWRVSIAEIESDGAFSAFPGCDRHIALLEGVGMELRFAGAESVRLERRLQFSSFVGEAECFGKLLAGPVRDFNVMTRRASCRAEILHRPLVGPMVFFPDAANWFIYLVAGTATVKDSATATPIETGESILLRPAQGGDRVVIDGGGEVVLLKFVPA
ncbi:MAG: HutD family protein [Proteobacteria bacterium]|nr:HutD family protein [Pseudomonadota bacterium]